MPTYRKKNKHTHTDTLHAAMGWENKTTQCVRGENGGKTLDTFFSPSATVCVCVCVRESFPKMGEKFGYRGKMFGLHFREA